MTQPETCPRCEDCGRERDSYSQGTLYCWRDTGTIGNTIAERACFKVALQSERAKREAAEAGAAATGQALSDCFARSASLRAQVSTLTERVRVAVEALEQFRVGHDEECAEVLYHEECDCEADKQNGLRDKALTALKGGEG